MNVERATHLHSNDAQLSLITHEAIPCAAVAVALGTIFTGEDKGMELSTMRLVRELHPEREHKLAVVRHHGLVCGGGFGRCGEHCTRHGGVQDTWTW